MYHEIICLRPTSTAAPGLGDALDLAFWGSSPPSLRQHGASAARGTRFTVSTSEAGATGGRDRGGAVLHDGAGPWPASRGARATAAATWFR